MVTTLSESEICNLSLDLLLQTNEETVVDITEPSTETEAICKRWYNASRRAVLRKRTWSFARSRKILTADTSGSPEFGWSTAHNLPNDYVRRVKLTDSSEQDAPPLLDTEFIVEGNQILSNITGNLYLVYIKDFTQTEFFDPLFVIHLAVEMALNMSYKFTGSNTNRQALLKIAEETMSAASSVNSAENKPRRTERSDVRTLRRRGLSRDDTTIWNG